jgi:hypothetical protein
MKKMVFLLFVFPSLLFSCSFGHSSVVKNDLITLSVICDSHCSVVGDAVVSVKKSADAVFKLSFLENYEFSSTTLGSFSDGLLTISDCQYSQTAFITSSLIGDVVITLNNDPTLGSVSLSPSKASYAVGDEVTITTENITDRPFLCYTKNNYYHNGVYGKTSLPFAFANPLKFKVTESVTICANYQVEDSWVIHYFANGGRTIDDLGMFTMDVIDFKPFINPSTFIVSNYLNRDGYTIDSLNTKPDGSGTRIGVGSKADQSLFKNKELNLYAIWEKWSDPSLFEIENGDGDTCSIVKYNGSDVKVVIPNKINGKVVAAVNAGSFSDSKIESVFFNESLEKMSDGAFSNCEALAEIHFFSSLKSSSGDVFNGCSLLTKCYITNNSYPTDFNCWERDFTWQYDYIDKIETNKPLLLYVTHSTGQWNNFVDTMSQTIGKYRPYIFYAVWGTSMPLMFSVALNHIKQTDKLIFLMHEGPCVNSIISYCNVCYIDNDFDELLKIDFREIMKVILNAFKEYSTLVSNKFDSDYMNPENLIMPTNFDYNYTLHETEGNLATTNCDPTSELDLSSFNTNCYSYFHYIDEIASKSVLLKKNIVFTWGPHNVNSITNMESFPQFESTFKSMFNGYTFLDSINDHIFSGDLFLKNDSMHLNPIGGAKRNSFWDPLIANL